MVLHDLKILSKFFDDVLSNRKNFEIRKYDRNYRVGDFLLLREFDGSCFTGRSVLRQIKYVYIGCDDYGLSKGYCVLGLKSKTIRVYNL